MPHPPSVPKVQRVSKSVTIRKDLADWMDEQAEARLISPALLVEKGLDLLKDHLEPSGLEDKVTTTTPHADPRHAADGG